MSVLVCVVLTVLAPSVTAPSATASASSTTVFVGGYGGNGIVRITIPDVPAATVAGAGPRGAAFRVSAMSSPTFLLAHPSLPLVYATSELSGGRRNLRALRPTGETVAAVWSGGANPVRLAINVAGDRLAVANYDGSVALLALDATGIPGPPLAVVRTSGSGPDLKRQAASHPHGVAFSPSGRSVYMTDLGADSVLRFDVGPTRSSLVVVQRLALPPGSGPRQIVLDGSQAYVANELSGTITSLVLSSDGTMAVTATTKLEDGGDPGEVLLDPTSRWLVLLVRGSGTCQVFDRATPGLRATSSTPCGVAPRFAEFFPEGDRLLIASTGDDTVRVATFDPDRGVIGPTVVVLSITKPAGIAARP